MVEGLPRGGRVELLGVVGAGPDHVMGVVAGVDGDGAHPPKVRDAAPEPAGEVDERLRLVLGRVLLGVGLENGASRLAGTGQGHVIAGFGTIQEHGDDPVLALVDRCRRPLTAHRPIHRLDRHLAGEGRRVGLPGGDLALAGLPCRGGGVKRLPDGLEDDLGGQSEQGAEPGCHRGPEVGDVVDAVGVEGDRAGQVDLDLIGGGHRPDQVRAVAMTVLGHGQERRDVVPGMGVLGAQEGVVIVEVADRDRVGPRRPFRGDPGGARAAEEARTRRVGVAQCLGAGAGHRRPGERGGGHRGVVDEAVDHHLSDLVVDRDGVGGESGQLPGQLLRAGQVGRAGVNPDLVLDHRPPSPVDSQDAKVRLVKMEGPAQAQARARVAGRATLGRDERVVPLEASIVRQLSIVP